MSDAEVPVGVGRKWGKAQRKTVSRRSHGDWSPASDRPDPVDVITAQNASRVQMLVPIRHWRMSQSPFSFYRGGAAVMAGDLAGTPVTGINAQICGDAHVSNFGVYGSPERELVFDLNDFDETLPGPWEWDVKRLTASFAIAARHNGLESKEQIALAQESAAAYRRAIRRFAELKYLDAWYAHLSVERPYAAFEDQLTKKDRKARAKFARKARFKDSVHAHNKLTEEADGVHRIASQAPLIIPLRDLVYEDDTDAVAAALRADFEGYLDSVPDHLAVLLRRFRFRDLALKVVGVGSVGTRCFIVLLEGHDATDPFFLQIKEATRSVLEDHLPDSTYEEHGERVVVGQRLMQAATDSFLGFNTATRSGTHYYWRQFKDMKGSLDVESASPAALRRYAQACGFTLARAHARSADSGAIAGYLGKGSAFDEAIGEFAVAYANQNEVDYAAFTAAIASGRIEAHE